MTDLTLETAMIAVQGPQALERLQPLVPVTLAEMGYYTGTTTRIDAHPAIVSRTGYTGEDGVEIVVSTAAALAIWERLVAAGGRAIGLGARDTLRLEAAMPLYGHELSEQVTPLHADLGFAVNLLGREFIGSQAIQRLPKSDLPRRIGLELSGKRVPREHYQVFHDETLVGEITSGTFSPTLQRPIAMAYVQPGAAAEGTQLQIDIRGSREPARVVRLPFYSRPR